MREQEMQENQVVSSEQACGKIRSFFAKRKKIFFALLLILPEIFVVSLLPQGVLGTLFIVPMSLLRSYLLVSLCFMIINTLRGKYQENLLKAFFVIGLVYFWASDGLPLKRVSELCFYIFIYFIEVVMIFYLSNNKKFVVNINKFLSIQMLVLMVRLVVLMFMFDQYDFMMFSISYVFEILFFAFPLLIFSFSWLTFLFFPLFSSLFLMRKTERTPCVEINTVALFFIAVFNTVFPDIIVYLFDYIPLIGTDGIKLFYSDVY